MVGLAARRGAGSESEDIATEAILRAAYSASMDERSPLRYLQRIVQNLTIDRHRRLASQSDQLIRLPVPAAGQRALDDCVADRDLAIRVLRRLYETEGPLTAALVWRRAVDQTSWITLAAEVGMSPSKLQSYVWRAIKNVRPWLQRQAQSKKDLA